MCGSIHREPWGKEPEVFHGSKGYGAQGTLGVSMHSHRVGKGAGCQSLAESCLVPGSSQHLRSRWPEQAPAAREIAQGKGSRPSSWEPLPIIHTNVKGRGFKDQTLTVALKNIRHTVPPGPLPFRIVRFSNSPLLVFFGCCCLWSPLFPLCTTEHIRGVIRARLLAGKQLEL